MAPGDGEQPSDLPRLLCLGLQELGPPRAPPPLGLDVPLARLAQQPLPEGAPLAPPQAHPLLAHRIRLRLRVHQPPGVEPPAQDARLLRCDARRELPPHVAVVRRGRSAAGLPPLAHPRPLLGRTPLHVPLLQVSTPSALDPLFFNPLVHSVLFSQVPPREEAQLRVGRTPHIQRQQG